MRYWFSILALVLCAGPAQGQNQAWANQWLQHAFSAQAGREYMGLYGTSGTNYTAGSNVTFTSTGPYTFRISASGGGGGSTSNFVAKSGDVMSGPLTNTTQLWMQDDLGGTPSINMFFRPGGPGTWLYGFQITPMTGLWGVGMYVGGDLKANDINGDTIYAASGFVGDGSGLTNVPTVGLTTNIAVVFTSTMTTNTLNFTNGLLMAINGSLAPVHGASLIQPGGSYLLQPSGGTLLLP
jgi:hypothetical protein